MNILVVLFLEAVTYDLADPDDHSCENSDSKSSCLSQKSSLARGESKCYWDDSNGTCHFRKVDQEFFRIVVVAVIVAIIGTPFAWIIEAAISNYIAAEAINETNPARVRPKKSSTILKTENSKDDGKAFMVARRTVMMLKRAEEALGNSAEDDFNALNIDITRYKATLNPSQRKEFEGEICLLCETLS